MENRIKEYIMFKLDQHGLDGAIYVDHILDLLASSHVSNNNDLQEFLTDCAIATDIKEFCESLKEVFRRGYLLEAEELELIPDDAVEIDKLQANAPVNAAYPYMPNTNDPDPDQIMYPPQTIEENYQQYAEQWEYHDADSNGWAYATYDQDATDAAASGIPIHEVPLNPYSYSGYDGSYDDNNYIPEQGDAAEMMPFSDAPIDQQQPLQQVDWMQLVDSVEYTLANFYGFTTEFAPEAVMQALYKCDYDPQLAASVLFQAAALLESCKPCRHMMKNKCVRSDCAFDHDLGKFPCRYWLYTVCAAVPNKDGGNGCLFAHDVPDPPPNAPALSADGSFENEAIPYTQGPLVNGSFPDSPTSAFPSLSEANQASSDGFKPKQLTSVFKGVGYLNATLKEKPIDSSSAFPSTANNDLFYNSQSTSFKRSSTKIGFADILIQHKFASSDKGRSTSNVFSTANKGILPGEWISEQSKSDYEQMRAEARQYAVARNRLLEQATAAYVG